MRKHCLVRTPPQVLLAEAADRHRGQRCPTCTTLVPTWIDRLRPQAVAWRSGGPGPWRVEWCLEAEPGANGTLAHLSVIAVDRCSRPYGRVGEAVLGVWARRELETLARSAQVVHGCYDRLTPADGRPVRPGGECGSAGDHVG